MTPSPQYDIFKAQINAAKNGDAKAMRIIRIMLEECCCPKDGDLMPDYAAIRLAECLLEIRRDDARRN